MEIRNVTTFVKIIETGSFTKAAETIGYSQATVTAQIKSLENELGVPLFDRIGKRVFLTDAGNKFLPYAINMIKAEEEALHSIRPMEELSGELRICSAASYAASVLPAFLLKFQELHPHVNVTVKISDYPEDTMLKLKRDEIDFLIELDEGYDQTDLNMVYKKKENVIFVTYPENPILKRKRIKLKDIVADHFIICDRSIGYSASLEKELNKKEIDFDAAMDIGSVEAIKSMLLGGYGTAFIPEYAVQEQLKSGKLAEIKTKEIEIELYTYLYCNKNKWINPIMQEFIKVFGNS